MLPNLVNLPLVALVATVLAGPPNVDGETCYSAVSSYAFSDLEAESYDYCGSVVVSGTVALCINQYYPFEATDLWEDYLASYYCTAEVADPPDYTRTLENATLYIGDAPIGYNVTDRPFLIDASMVSAWHHTNYAYYDNVYLSETYGWIIIVLISATMSFAGMLRLLKHYSRYMQTVSPGPIRFLQQHLTVPALLNGSHSHRPSVLGVEFSIPTRLETFFLASFIIINVIMTFVNFDIFSGNFYWPLNIDQFQRYVADRSGILSIAQFPLLFAFAGRNTIFIWITGWSYETFSVFHKWIARMSVFQAFIHTIAYTCSFYRAGGLAYMNYYYEDAYLRWGAAAMVAGFILLSGAMYSIRKRWYECFLVSHIIFAVVWLVGTFYHVKLLEEPQYMPWLWTAVAFWAFDRFLRILRLLYINGPFHLVAGRAATVVVLQEDVLQIEVPVPSRWSSSPGQYAFLYFPSFKGWQSHPFTIADVSSTTGVKDIPMVVKNSTEIYTTEIDASAPAPSTSPLRTLKFVLRSHKGITSQLLKAAVSNGGQLQTKVLVEGPYGSTHNLDHFDKVILVAGGLGITACLPFLSKMVSSSTLRHQEVILHWVVREERSLEWFRTTFVQLLQSQQSQSVPRLRIHVTGTTGKSESDIDESTDHALRGIEVSHGRPGLKALIHDEIAVGKEHSTHAVLSCGPGTFSDDCRAAVVSALAETSTKSIRYFEESFTW